MRFRVCFSRVEQDSVFVTAMVIISTPLTLNSSIITLCLRWELVCQEVSLNICSNLSCSLFVLSCVISFVLSFREGLSMCSCLSYISVLLLLVLLNLLEWW